MPTATPFKFAGAISSDGGAGFNGLPIINPTEVDVTSYFKVQALDADEICEIFWNYAGIQVDLEATTESTGVEFISTTRDDGSGGTETFTNQTKATVTLNKEVLLSNDSDGFGADPSERTFALPFNTFEESKAFSDADTSVDPNPYFVEVNATAFSVGTLRALYDGGSFIGYGMTLYAVNARMDNRSTVQNEQNHITEVVASYFETEDANSEYSQISVNGQLFWKQEKEVISNNPPASEQYITEDNVSINSVTPVFYTY
jgi:hypothetical protein